MLFSSFLTYSFVRNCFFKGAREDSLNHVTKPVYSSSVASPVWKDGLKVREAFGLFLCELRNITFCFTAACVTMIKIWRSHLLGRSYVTCYDKNFGFSFVDGLQNKQSFFSHIPSRVTRSSRCPRSRRARVSVSLKKRKKKENFLQVILPSSELSPYFNTTLHLTVWYCWLVWQVFPRRIYHRCMVVIVHLHELVLDTTQTKTSYSLQGQVRGIRPLQILY